MKIRRREFLKGCAGTLAAVIPFSPLQVAAGRKLPRRRLGRTKWKATILGYGAMQCADPAVIRHGIDLGINYIDTADCYMGGQNERIVGQAIKGVRRKLFIATKVHPSSEARMRRSVERSLQSLGVDSVDLMQLHGLSARGQVLNQGTVEIMRKMRDEGLFRFAGVTTHSGQVQVIDAVVEGGFYDTVLVAVNYRSPGQVKDSIAAAADTGVGIIAMKTQNGGYTNSPFPGLNGHQASLRHVLEFDGITTAVPGMLSRKMVDENLAAAGTPGSLADHLALESLRADLSGRACSFCSECVGQCRYGQGAVDVSRIRMYVEGYGDRRLARERAAYAAAAIERCSKCTVCTVSCPQGLDAPESARIVSEALGV